MSFVSFLRICRRHLKWILLAALVVAAGLGLRFVLGRPAFDPDKVARAEAQMWQAYYTDNRVQLALELITLLRTQHGLSLPEAKTIGELLVESAMKFRAARGDYERVALPELTEAYRRIRRATGASFDPETVARAELAWWIARRTPGQNSVERVGEKIADLYSVLYGSDHPSFVTAGLLRAEAAALRAAEGREVDWDRVEDLLRESYREIAKAFPRTGQT